MEWALAGFCFLCVTIWFLTSRNRLAVLRHRVDAARCLLEVEAGERRLLLADLLERLETLGYPVPELQRTAAIGGDSPAAGVAFVDPLLRNGVDDLLRELSRSSEVWRDEVVARIERNLEDLSRKMEQALRFYDEGVRKYNDALQRLSLRLPAHLFAFRPRDPLPTPPSDGTSTRS